MGTRCVPGIALNVGVQRETRHSSVLKGVTVEEDTMATHTYTVIVMG